VRIRQTENGQKWTRQVQRKTAAGRKGEGGKGRGGHGGGGAAQQNRPTAWLQVADEKPAGDSSGSFGWASKEAPRFKSLAPFLFGVFEGQQGCQVCHMCIKTRVLT